MTPKIYKITNDINSKIYVGQTCKTVEDRFKRHCSEARWRNTKNMPIVMAIKKYGEKHFKPELLEELSINSNQEYVDSKEVEWGLKLNSLSPNGYNLKLGNGHGALSEETKRKIGKSNTGRKISEKTRKRLSLSHMGHINSEETRKKISEYFKGKPTHINTNIGASKKNSKTYIFLSPTNKKIIIKNMKKFCQKNSLNKGDMSSLVTGKKKTYKGWTFVEDLGFNNEKRH